MCQKISRFCVSHSKYLIKISQNNFYRPASAEKPQKSFQNSLFAHSWEANCVHLSTHIHCSSISIQYLKVLKIPLDTYRCFYKCWSWIQASYQRIDTFCESHEGSVDVSPKNKSIEYFFKLKSTSTLSIAHTLCCKLKIFLLT